MKILLIHSFMGWLVHSSAICINLPTRIFTNKSPEKVTRNERSTRNRKSWSAFLFPEDRKCY